MTFPNIYDKYASFIVSSSNKKNHKLKRERIIEDLMEFNFVYKVKFKTKKVINSNDTKILNTHFFIYVESNVYVLRRIDGFSLDEKIDFFKDKSFSFEILDI